MEYRLKKKKTVAAAVAAQTTYAYFTKSNIDRDPSQRFPSL